jgi:hypothetical protein
VLWVSCWRHRCVALAVLWLICSRQIGSSNSVRHLAAHFAVGSAAAAAAVVVLTIDVRDAEAV